MRRVIDYRLDKDKRKLVCQYEDEDIDEGVEEQQQLAEASKETTMYKNENLIEKQQRYFNQRLNDAYWAKELELRNKHSFEETVTMKNVNWDAHEKDCKFLRAQKEQAEDIIMVGDPVKMLEAVNAFQNITIY